MAYPLMTNQGALPGQYIIVPNSYAIEKPEKTTGDDVDPYGPSRFNFSKSRFSTVNKCHLNLARVIILVVNFMMLATAVAISEFAWFFYYLTYWAYFVTVFSVIACCQDSITMFPRVTPNGWQKPAAILLEIATGMNLIVTILFWTCIAPELFKHLSWHGLELFEAVRMVTVHTVPFITTVIQLVLSDVTLRRSDYKMVFFFTWSYTIANYIGTMNMGAPLYPIVTWESYPQTCACFLGMAMLMSGVYYVVAIITEKVTGKPAM